MNRMPADWLDALSAENVPLSNLTLAIDTFPDFSTWSTSLQSFLKSCRDLAMPRDPNLAIRVTRTSPSLSTSPIDRLDPVLCVGMKYKKIHEVAHLSNVIHDLCGDTCDVVDVGSGKGYISQALSHHFGYHVIGLEGNEGQHQKATERFTKTEERRSARKQSPPPLPSPSTSSSICHTTAMDHSTVNFMLGYSIRSDDLDALVTPSLAHPTSSLCLMSLHACGDLSPILLELYTHWERAGTLVNVSCCYHKIATKSLESGKGFPMSSFISDCLSTGIDLNPHSYWLEMATGCPLKWQAMDARAMEIRINKLAFRSVLELLFRKCLAQTPSFAPSAYLECIIHVQKMRSESVYESFDEYLKAALPRCKVKRNRSDSHPILASELSSHWHELQQKVLDMSQEVYAQFEPQRRAMKVWLALESCIAPVAESLVLFDRWQYLEEFGRQQMKASEEGTAKEEGNVSLQEHPHSDATNSPVSSGVSSIVPWIVPVFDQEESPRNLALIATKVTQKSADPSAS